MSGRNHDVLGWRCWFAKDMELSTGYINTRCIVSNINTDPSPCGKWQLGRLSRGWRRIVAEERLCVYL